MPLYDYKCDECGHTFERTLRIADMKLPEGETCPSCAKEGTVKKHLAGAPPLADPTRLGDTQKLPGDFKDVLRKIHERTPRSNLNLKF
jgi:putative FmdB family regulatory protein